jgi:hypothetical protein
MHNPAKYGAKIRIFSFWKPQTLAHSLWNWRNLVRGSSLMWGFFMKIPICHVFLFSLQLSHLFSYFWISNGHLNVGQTFKTPLTTWKPRQNPACPVLTLTPNCNRWIKPYRLMDAVRDRVF